MGCVVNIICRLLGHKRVHEADLASGHAQDAMGVWHAQLHKAACVRCGTREFVGTMIVDGCDELGCDGGWACNGLCEDVVVRLPANVGNEGPAACGRSLSID